MFIVPKAKFKSSFIVKGRQSIQNCSLSSSTLVAVTLKIQTVLILLEDNIQIQQFHQVLLIKQNNTGKYCLTGVLLIKTFNLHGTALSAI